jgi:hypothetical protein
LWVVFPTVLLYRFHGFFKHGFHRFKTDFTDCECCEWSVVSSDTEQLGNTDTEFIIMN